MNQRRLNVPEKAIEVNDPSSSAVCYLFERNGHLCAVGFSGRRNKPDFRYRYGNEEQRERDVSNHLEKIRQQEQVKEAQRQARAAFSHTLKTGDILYSSWGYDQTNIDYYEVVRVKSKKTVVLRQLNKTTTETGFMSGETLPNRGKYLGKALVKRVSEGNKVKIEKYCGTASVWDGKAKSCSWYA